MDAEDWISGNRVALLENGEAFFPRLFEVVNEAREEVLIETFIVFEDEIGRRLRDVLVRAARRGVRVVLHMDDYGSGDLSDEFVESLTDAGVEVRWYGPGPSLFGFRPNLFRRLHRKLAVIDRKRAFVGGINFSDSHLKESGPEGKQDYAVEVTGPVIKDILRIAQPSGERRRAGETAPPPASATPDSVKARVVQRDNGRHKRDIENDYIRAIRSAQKDVIIANAYFAPGYRLFRQMRNAARRGVRVRLVIQAYPDQPLALAVSRLLYDSLLDAGVQIHELRKNALHAKVAVVDDHWATVGSSNLDPLSLFLNLEANLMIQDREFNETLRSSLLQVIKASTRVTEYRHNRLALFGQRGLAVLAYHSLRYFPSLSKWLPGHAQRSIPHERLRARNTPVAHTVPKEAAKEDAA